MPPTKAHFNGSVNLADTETVMREIVTRVPTGLTRIPDGETGDRANWIFFQLDKFFQTDGLEQARPAGQPEEGYQTIPKVQLSEGADPADLQWPDLGYAAVYQESYASYRRLRDEGVLPAGVRFQVQYPTPLASISAYVVPEQQAQLEPSYEQALFADLDILLAAVPHEDLAVQWDVAVEFGILEGGFEPAEGLDFDALVARLVRCVDRVPADVPVGLHLCYGDYGHQHFVQPPSIALQVQVANAVSASAGRAVSWLSFTVPQNRGDAEFFAPLADLEVPPATELYLALVPYHPDDQAPGTTAEQVRVIDELLGAREWGICTECGLGRAQREEVPALIDLHRSILAH